MATPIDPVFIFLPIFEEARMKVRLLLFLKLFDELGGVILSCFANVNMQTEEPFVGKVDGETQSCCESMFQHFEIGFEVTSIKK